MFFSQLNVYMHLPATCGLFNSFHYRAFYNYHSWLHLFFKHFLPLTSIYNSSYFPWFSPLFFLLFLFSHIHLRASRKPQTHNLRHFTKTCSKLFSISSQAFDHAAHVLAAMFAACPPGHWPAERSCPTFSFRFRLPFQSRAKRQRLNAEAGGLESQHRGAEGQQTGPSWCGRALDLEGKQESCAQVRPRWQVAA